MAGRKNKSRNRYGQNDRRGSANPNDTRKRKKKTRPPRQPYLTHYSQFTYGFLQQMVHRPPPKRASRALVAPPNESPGLYLFVKTDTNTLVPL